ncbi:tight adherence protein B [Leucobacter exalbidus]|uniref:Tight adherence protein B n=1 Tax=Leucobacter exalbidus TaxID=662960 RepID=A0A940T4N7_9MICO|nr:type II secretion system F family protein [Leucobacter exalbidus]MBP1327014.1 tight adherence protein B [Leucobacter exalbidus]
MPPQVSGVLARLRAMGRALRCTGERLSPAQRQAPAPAAEHEGAARVARQMSALLAGGVSTERMFELVRHDVADTGEAGRITRLVADGVAPADALASGRGPEWRVLAAAWDLAVTSGAPLGPALSRMTEALAALERLRERRSVILTGPKATVVTVAALPPLALLLGVVLGFDPTPILASPVGGLLLGVGAVLLACGVGWARMLQRQVEANDHVAGIECELAWIVMRGGGDPGTAPRLVADAVDRAGAEWVPFTQFLAGAPLRRAISSAQAAGVPLASLLLEEAEAERARSHAQLERDAEQLGIRVLIPLAVCVLPSFILVGVVPVVLSMLRG